MLRFNLLPIFLSLVIFIILIFFLRKKRQKSLTYLLFWSVFYVYIINVIRYTQFPLFIVEYPFDYHFSNYIQLIPTNPFNDALHTTILNTILTIPFGFGLPFLLRIDLKKILLSALIFSLSIELLQLVPHLLFEGHNRIIDVNDVIFNTLGGLIGYLFFKLFALLFNFVSSKFHFKMNPIISHIDHTVKGS